MTCYDIKEDELSRLIVHTHGVNENNLGAFMTFSKKLAHGAQLVEQTLDTILSTHNINTPPPERLVEAMRYAVLGGGKRFRPFLVLESAALLEVSSEDALPAAAALECIHCYSLIHDDLPAMDDDNLRRGRPTVHIAFDEATAILAGDALLTLAFEILTDQITRQSASVREELVLHLARAAGWTGMAGGQVLDLQAEGLDLTEVQIREIQAMKTGALITFACEAGAILAKADAKEREALTIYGQTLGLAFQIADDLLDVEGDKRTVGKSIGKDEAAGKATLVSILGPEEARNLLNKLEERAVQALFPFGGKAETLREAAQFVIRRQH